MAEVYVTLGEAAELEGVKYKTMAQRLSRKKECYGFEVILTRSNQATDRGLYDRGYAAKGCVLFISDHSNACGTESVDYPVVYRGYDNIGNCDELALKLAKVIASTMGTAQAGRTATRKGSSGDEYYGVLRGARAAGLSDYYIIEHSFHTNTKMTKWLLNDSNLRKLAEAECKVIAEHYGMTKQADDKDSMTKITGKAEATAEQMTAYIKAKNGSVAQSVLDMIPLYLSEGEAENIRGDIAFAQSCLETGNFTFSGSAVKLSQNNFCGMGVTQNGMEGNSFDTPQLGIRAQIQHLKAYANTTKLKQDCIDPRFELVSRGCAPYVEYLGIQENPKGKGWAAGAGYGEKILKILDAIKGTGDSQAGDGSQKPDDTKKLPITGEAELATTGLTAKFTDAEGGDSFKEGDRFTFSTTSPAMSNESVISAVESLINSPLMFEFVHIVGVSSKALWASLCTLANDFLTKYKRPLYFVCEARGKKADESLEDYVNAMLEERKGINNIYMQVVCSNSRYQRMDGRVQDINNAGIVTGLYGRAKESQSIGEVKSFPISEAKLLKLLPEGIEDYIETLDKAKYVTIRQYIGKEDYYVTSANMMSPEGSDYSYAEDVRVSNRLVKAVRAKALDELQVEVDPEDIETSITNIQEQLNTPVEDAVRDKIISSGSVSIDTENLNILVDESLDIRITYVPMGHVREMNLTFAVENPYAAS